MSPKPLLSAIVPNFNHARFLPESLGALLAQDYEPFEVIVVDDGSTDGSVEVIRRFARADPRLRLVRQDRNRGVIEALRRGLAETQGEFVCFPSADDMALPGFLGRSVALLERHPEAGACSALVFVMDAQGRPQGRFDGLVPSRRESFVTPARAQELLREHGSWYMGPAAVYRREAFLEAGGYRDELGPLADEFLFQVIALKRGVCFIPEPLASWRRMEGTYSWKSAYDLEASLAIAGRATALMRTHHGDLFPEAVVARWERRFLFGLGSLLLGAGKAPPRGLARLLPGPRRGDALFLAGLRLAHQAHPGLARLGLFLRLRLPDAWSVVSRRAGWMPCA